MEDKDIKDLFVGFNPTLKSDNSFMQRLNAHLDAVETAKTTLETMRRRNRVAIFIAAFVGFLTGIIFSYAMPYIMPLLHSICNLIPAGSIASAFLSNLSIIGWILTSAAIVLAAIQTYDLSLRVLIRFQSPTQ